MGVNASGLAKRLGGHRVLLDTTVLIAYFNRTDFTHAVAVELIDNLVKSGSNPAIISPVAAMEILIVPLRRGAGAVTTVHDFINNWPNLDLVPIDLHVAQEVASLCATHNFRTPDALVAATGITSQVGHLITNDKNWRSKLTPIKNRIQVTMLADYVVDAH